MSVRRRTAAAPDVGGVWPALLLPYVAVGVGWMLLESAWVALGIYHLGILALARAQLPGRLERLVAGRSPRFVAGVLLLLPVAALGFLGALPHLVRPGFVPDVWLAQRGLEGRGVLLLVLVYGCVHPVLEELHFQRLRALAARRAHLAYAGYHGLVLASCFRGWAVGATVVFLVLTSAAFGAFERGPGGPRLSLLLHLAADLVVAVVALRWSGWI